MPSITSWFWGSSSSSSGGRDNTNKDDYKSNSSTIPPSLQPSQEPKQEHQPPLSSTTDTTSATTTGLPNNLKVLLGGITFFVLSSVITRRALTRRQRASIPPFYTGSTYHKPPVNGAIEALEALNIATVNVVSVSMIVVGGALYAMDINSIGDMQRLVRGGLGYDGTGRNEQQVEEELEEWLAGVLNRKAEKEKAKDSRGRKVIVIDEDGQEEIEKVWRNERGERR